MKKLLMILMTFFVVNTTNAQFFKEIYEDFLKYGTVCGGTGDIRNAHI